MAVTRRRLLQAAAVLSAAPAGVLHATPADQPVRGGQLIIGQFPEPPSLTSISTAGPNAAISGKIFDGLLTYDFDLKPQPQLATAWDVSPDGLTVSFDLRPGVTWHDGAPFTSADVAFSLQQVWRQFHARGRGTFANVAAVETPTPLRVVLRLSKPAPYLLSALAAVESQVLPRHLYEGRDILANPLNLAPVGTGPFRFKAWERGSYIALERNPTYWDQPKPYLDRIIFRLMPDPATRATALETGEILLAGLSAVPLSDIDRLGRVPVLELETRGYAYTAGVNFLEFNLDRPAFQDVRVRRAFAHAVDRDFIVRTIYAGRAVPSGPIPPFLAPFHTDDVPRYPFDLARAAALLDEAGVKPGPGGVRLSVHLDANPGGGDTDQRIGEYLRSTLARIGVELKLRRQDFAGFVRRIYTDRDFDLSITGGNAAPDPAVSTQRFYWSKNFQPGVAFSNGAHYASAEADRLLEAAQVELDPGRRAALYHDFQRVVATDLPNIPLVSVQYLTVANRRLRRHTVDALGIYGNFAQAWLAPA